MFPPANFQFVDKDNLHAKLVVKKKMLLVTKVTFILEVWKTQRVRVIRRNIYINKHNMYIHILTLKYVI